jgi:predicted acyl esterase
VGLPAWPPAAPKFRSWFLTQGRLMDDAPAEEALSHLSPQTLGLASGEIMPWFAYAPGAELPGDQRTDDGAALCFDTAPLDEAVDCRLNPCGPGSGWHVCRTQLAGPWRLEALIRCNAETL